MQHRYCKFKFAQGHVYVQLACRAVHFTFALLLRYVGYYLTGHRGKPSGGYLTIIGGQPKLIAKSFSITISTLIIVMISLFQHASMVSHHISTCVDSVDI